MNILEIENLIWSEVGANHNKWYKATLYDNSTFLAEWGRVGYGAQTKTYSGGKYEFDKQITRKIKKGYKRSKIISNSAPMVEVSNLHEIAKKQIKTTKISPELDALISRLVNANIHKITQNTKIQYNSNSGLFTTPLGFVTSDAIVEARNLLVKIQYFIKKSDHGNKKLFGIVGDYLTLIPQNTGMKLDTRILFPDENAVLKQNDILDSLEASYKALSTTPKTNNENEVSEQVFEVELDILDDDREKRRLNTWFESSKKSMHGYNNTKIQKIYKVDIKSMTRSFDLTPGNKQEVFHGSSEANSLSILKSGLKISPPSSAFICGKLFGNGVYGSKTSTKSLGYCFGRWGNSKDNIGNLWVCDFVMGKVYYPTSYGISKFPNGYDSCWALPGKTSLYNDELIVYKENQIKIKYLLEIKS